MGRVNWANSFTTKEACKCRAIVLSPIHNNNNNNNKKNKSKFATETTLKVTGGVLQPQ